MTAFTLITLGVVLLYTGGEVLVGSVSRLAVALRVSPLIIGLTVVAFGTSSPEVAVAVGAGLTGKADIALGNVLGSNIANIGLILGLSALVRPVTAHASFLRRDLPFMLVVSVLLLPAAWLAGFTRPLGLLLLALLAGYLWVLFRGSGSQRVEEGGAAPPPTTADKAVGLAGAAVGIGLLVFGADVLVDAAVELARNLGISERIIGLTLVAFGTSLPELAGCLVAAVHSEGEIVVGNVTGSNIFNTLLVLPVAVLVLPFAATPSAMIDVAVMISFSLMVVLLYFRRGGLGRVEGVGLLAAYFVYVGYLFVG